MICIRCATTAVAMLRATIASLLVGPLLAAAALHPVQQDARKLLQRAFNTTDVIHDVISQQRRHADEFAATATTSRLYGRCTQPCASSLRCSNHATRSTSLPPRRITLLETLHVV